MDQMLIMDKKRTVGVYEDLTLYMPNIDRNISLDHSRRVSAVSAIVS